VAQKLRSLCRHASISDASGANHLNIQRSLLTTTALVFLGVSLSAQAQVASAVSANVGLTSKYKYRGQDQSDDSKAVLPAVQGGFDFANGGLYVGNWNSSVGFLGGTEMDFYAGYRGEFANFSYDLGALYYYYPGSVSAANTSELYASLGYGPASVKLSTTVSSKYFGVPGGRGTNYLEANWRQEVSSGVFLVGHVGQTLFGSESKNNGGINYADYKIGADVDLGSGFTAGAGYVGATKKGQIGDINKSRLVFSISKAL
jgi:uncharacterized protein (TIGR02001 family)